MTGEKNQQDARIVVDDKEKHELGATFNEWLVFKSTPLMLDQTRMLYVLKVSCMDGKANITMSNIRYIYEERNAAANCHETLYTDGSAECTKNEDPACERYSLTHGKTQVELLCNLDKLPTAGAVIFTAWLNFRGVNGLPCRA